MFGEKFVNLNKFYDGYERTEQLCLKLRNVEIDGWDMSAGQKKTEKQSKH